MDDESLRERIHRLVDEEHCLENLASGKRSDADHARIAAMIDDRRGLRAVAGSRAMTCGALGGAVCAAELWDEGKPRERTYGVCE